MVFLSLDSLIMAWAIPWAESCTSELQMKVNCRKKIGLVSQLLAEPAQNFPFNTLSVYNSLSAAFHLYMIWAYVCVHCTLTHVLRHFNYFLHFEFWQEKFISFYSFFRSQTIGGKKTYAKQNCWIENPVYKITIFNPKCKRKPDLACVFLHRLENLWSGITKYSNVHIIT